MKSFKNRFLSGVHLALRTIAVLALLAFSQIGLSQSHFYEVIIHPDSVGPSMDFYRYQRGFDGFSVNQAGHIIARMYGNPWVFRYNPPGTELALTPGPNAFVGPRSLFSMRAPYAGSFNQEGPVDLQYGRLRDARAYFERRYGPVSFVSDPDMLLPHRDHRSKLATMTGSHESNAFAVVRNPAHVPLPPQVSDPYRGPWIDAARELPPTIDNIRVIRAAAATEVLPPSPFLMQFEMEPPPAPPSIYQRLRIPALAPPPPMVLAYEEGGVVKFLNAAGQEITVASVMRPAPPPGPFELMRPPPLKTVTYPETPHGPTPSTKLGTLWRYTRPVLPIVGGAGSVVGVTARGPESILDPFRIGIYGARILINGTGEPRISRYEGLIRMLDNVNNGAYDLHVPGGPS